MPPKTDPGKILQVGFLILLAISCAQIAWWMGENVFYSREVARQFEALYNGSAEAINAAASGKIERLPAHFVFDEDAREVRVDPLALARIRDTSARRINRYFWEGGFFLLVLVGGMAVLTMALRHDASLRRRQSNFLASVSHEFKSPLASILLAADTLKRRCNDPETRRWVPRIQTDCERLLVTVENLLDSARLEEGKHKLEPQIVELAPVAKTVVDDVHERAERDGIEIVMSDLDSISLRADPLALEAILRNLVDNALKACVSGGGDLIRINAERRNHEIEVTVRDNGMGFPPEDSRLLFEKFYRVGDELRRNTVGTGLGLYIVQQFAALCGARVRAQSDGPGRGAAVTVIWPEPADQ